MAICMLFSLPLASQMPVLNVNGKLSTEVYLQSLDIQVDVIGNVASTKFTMVFKNRTSKILEGELLFPMPDGVTVSSYALDINGRMRDAVPVEKAKATQVFEEIEQRRVDPGLLERVEGNNFRTRIYPIPSNGTRTITIGYEQELTIENGMLKYRLPMDYKEAIEKFSLKATVLQSKEKPVVNSKSDELKFDSQGTNYVASFTRNNYKPSNSLEFSLPVPKDVPQVVMQSASGSYYFVASCMPKVDTRNKVWENNIGIIWDASLSGLQKNKEKELELLDFLIKEKKDASITLYVLNNRFKKAGTYTIKNANWEQLRKAIENITYDGGTDYSTIDIKKADESEFLLFSDGISTLSDANFTVGLNKAVHCIVSSPKADYSALKLIAAQTGGKYINLNALSQEAAKNEVKYEKLQFIGIEKPSSVREVYPSMATPVSNNFSIAGIMDGASADITLLFGYGNKVENRVAVKLQSKNASQQGFVHRIWAQKKINELDMQYEKNKEELTELGEQFGIVTRNTSLIVLETLQDYITYNITPPAELRDQFMQWRKGQEDQRRNMQQSLLNSAITAATELKTWWDTDFKPKVPKYPVPDTKSNENTTDARRQVQQSPASPLPPPIGDVDEIVIVDNTILADMDFMEEEDVPMAYIAADRVSNEQTERASEGQMQMNKRIGYKSQAVAKPTIKIAPLKQDSDYFKALTGNTEKDYAKYFELREEYLNTPTFYFDMADWFFTHKDKEKALCVLSSIAELDLENASLFRLLGYRFKEYGEYALETYICKKVIQWRPMEPQSYRDYALALADAGKYQDAINSLHSLLNQSYAQNISSNSAGIEEVIVTEINELITTKKVDHSLVEKELVKAMPVDIRVVLNWNMNNTDIDLHVKDPYGETCYYSNRQTKIGGRISRDITRGYGPEQFMLKKAPKGKYEVFVNYFGDSQVKAEGPSTLMLEIYTNFSDSSQERQVVCVQLSKEKKAKDGLLKVAEFNF